MNVTDEEKSNQAVEEFYTDIASIIHLLRLIAENTHYEPEQSAEIFRKYANLFWAPAKGEMTEGQPNFRRRRRSASRDKT